MICHLFPILLLLAVCPAWAETARDRPLSDVTWHRDYQDRKRAEGAGADLALEYSDLLQQSPGDAYVHLHYARALDPMEDYATIHQHLVRATELDPEMFWAHYSLGSLLLLVDSLNPAEKELLRAVEISPDSAEAHHNLAALYWRKGDIASSRAHVTKALALRPDYEAAEELLDDIDARRTHRDSFLWYVVLAMIILLIVGNVALLRKRYRKHRAENDAFEYARNHSVRYGRRTRPGARREQGRLREVESGRLPRRPEK